MCRLFRNEPLARALLVTSSGVLVQGGHPPAGQTLGQIRFLRMDRVRVWHALSHIGTPLRALVLGSVPFARMWCSARTAFIVSAATYIPQGILLLVWSVTRVPSLRAMTRKSSCLISCSHSAPEGGFPQQLIAAARLPNSCGGPPPDKRMRRFASSRE
jgi:hypothetical protein